MSEEALYANRARQRPSRDRTSCGIEHDIRDSGILIYGGARFLQPKNRNAHLFQDESHRVLPERREDLPYKSRLIAGVKMEKHEGSFILRIKIATFGVGKKYARECTK